MATPDLLAQRERQLELIMALDSARDAVEVTTDPNSMFGAIVQLLKSHFDADVCAVTLMEEGPNDTIEAMAYAGTAEETAVKLCRQAMKLKIPGPLETEVWPYTLGVPIVHETHSSKPVGGLILAREATPFAERHLRLLEIAESQIDSAVMQARLIWKLASHNRELEAIYQIDRMRDDHPDESAMINGFTAMLVEYFSADVCMVFLSHIDSGDVILRGIVDKENLPLAAIETIRELSGKVSIPQMVQTPPEIEELHLLAAPLVSSAQKLGSVVVGRKTAFTAADYRLLYAMMSQMDSALAHGRVIQQLFQRNNELETIYNIDHIRDSASDFDTMLQSVVNELCQAVSSEMGYLMLYNAASEQQLEVKATTTEDILASPVYYEAINRISRKALAKGEPVYSNKPEGAVRSIVAVPLILNDTIIGVFGTVNSKNPRGFSAEDRRMLTAITSQVDTAVFEQLERRRMRRVLSRSVDPKVLEHMLNSADDTILTGERVVLSVVFADLRGSTEWAERIEPEELVRTLNAFLGRMTEVIFKHGGTLDKFVGDEVIALFGTPVPMPDHALVAVRCALEMQEAHKQLRAELNEQDIELPPMGVGISSGEVIAGEFGPPIRTDFTAMGRIVNLGSRLCSAADAEQIIISPLTREMIGGQADVRALEPTSLKGIGEVEVFELLGLGG